MSIFPAQQLLHRQQHAQPATLVGKFDDLYLGFEFTKQ